MTMTLRQASRKAAFCIAIGSTAVLLSVVGAHGASPDVADAAHAWRHGRAAEVSWPRRPT